MGGQLIYSYANNYFIYFNDIDWFQLLKCENLWTILQNY